MTTESKPKFNITEIVYYVCEDNNKTYLSLQRTVLKFNHRSATVFGYEKFCCKRNHIFWIAWTIVGSCWTSGEVV